ncbi:MAG: glycosyltransferase [Terracidiphilus sp.]|jgi:glycosyltransferase involved in cell wall biosynthesis
MNETMPRVAYFPDSFHEVNGVAHTSRHFEAFARRRNLPFLCVRAGDRTQAILEEGNVWTLELPRGFLSFALEKDLRFDPAFLRHIPLIGEVLERFKPDLIHITGPSEVGMLGAWLAHHLGVPLAASWHTNVHEYLARRSDWFLRLLPKRQSHRTEQKIEDLTMAAAAKFYSVAQVLFAPNPELCALLERTTGRTCHLMPRGVDAELFHPSKRNRDPEDRDQVLGFVGRLSIEKNVTLLAKVQQELEAMGHKSFRFVIVGHGAEEAWLRDRMPRAEITGVLKGEALSAAYANMDLFVFPSHTDTFGNVVLEALASGVPAIVTPDGGPPSIVRDGVTGRIVEDEDFASAVAGVLGDPVKHEEMRVKAREYALTMSWDSVFEGVYAAYETMLQGQRDSESASQQAS